jgi:hypothetical protein
MKLPLKTSLLLPFALALASCATTGSTSSDAGAPAGPHSAQKIAIVRMKPGAVASDSLEHSLCLALKVDSKMDNGRQVITASASSHLDGPAGKPEKVKTLGVHVTQPLDMHSEGKDGIQAQVSNSIPAAGGKYKAVTAEAFMTSPDIADQKITLIVPGD